MRNTGRSDFERLAREFVLRIDLDNGQFSKKNVVRIVPRRSIANLSNIVI